MARLTWARGGSVEKMAIPIRQRRDDLKEQCREALEQAISDGADLVREGLLVAITRTGLERERMRGGLPGRYETGNMYDSVSDNSGNLTEIAEALYGSFGWFAGDFEQYFRDQDLGEGKIPAANALSDAYLFVREQLRAELKRIADGGSRVI